MNPTGIKQYMFSKINLAMCIVLSVFSMYLLPSLCLSQQAEAGGYERIVIPRPGCGAGERSWASIQEVLKPILDDRFFVITFK